MKLQKLSARQAVARELDAHDESFRTVNSIPEVAAARAKSDEARRASDRASREFSHIFDSYTKRGVAARLAKQYPGLILLGDGDLGEEHKWIARCAVTRLPIFVGDRVYIGGGDEDYSRTYILAEAVTLADGYDIKSVTVGANGLSESAA